MSSRLYFLLFPCSSCPQFFEQLPSTSAALSAANSQLGANFDFGPSDIEAEDPHHLLMMTYATRLRSAGPALGNGHAVPELKVVSKTNQGSFSCPTASEIGVGDKVSCSLTFEEPVSHTSGVEFRVNGPNGVSVLWKQRIAVDL